MNSIDFHKNYQKLKALEHLDELPFEVDQISSSDTSEPESEEHH